MSNYREHSRSNWRPLGDGVPTNDEIQIGCLQRIADAMEKVAARYDEIIAERDRAISSRDFLRSELERSERKRRSLKGAITRLKRGGAR